MIPFLTVVKHILHLQLHVLYLVLHLFYTKIQEVYLHFTSSNQIPSGKVRIRSILWKHKLDPEEISRKQDFLLTVGSLEDTSILDSPNWHLYCVEKDRVFFVLLLNKITEYSVARFPFMFVPVWEQAVAVAEVEREEFVRFSGFLAQRPQPKTVLFTNTARCGSTLLAKMLHRGPAHSICYGEPHSLSNIAVAYGEGFINEEEARGLLKATIICLRAHIPKDTVCILKTTSGEARLVPLCEGISNLKHIFMFRKKGLMSVEKMVRREECLYSLLLLIYLFSRPFSHFIGYLMAAEGKWISNLRADTMRLWAAVIYGSPYSDYLRNQSLYCHPVVWFHDIIEDTENTLRSLFEAIDISTDCVDAAIQCKEEDSQKGSFLSSANLKHVKLEPLSDEEYCKLTLFATRMNIPVETFEV